MNLNFAKIIIIKKQLLYLLFCITLASCTSTTRNLAETGSAAIDPEHVGLSIQYDLGRHAFKLKPFYSPAAQEITKPNLIETSPAIIPSMYADPSNPKVDSKAPQPTSEAVMLSP